MTTDPLPTPGPEPMAQGRAPTPPSSTAAAPLIDTVPDRDPDGAGHPVPAPELATGVIPDRYETIAVIGSGSTGCVLAARDRTFDRVVALKLLSIGDSLTTAQFIREARITASLEHPNIAPIYDLEFAPSGAVYFTMRRIAGQSLGTAITQAAAGTAPACIGTINERISIILKVCDALMLAHARGIIHQDVKPDNIMLGAFGEVLLVDWGEARLRDDARAGTHVAGTPLYMSPEQARGQHANEASDVYGIGATLFHVLLLRPPLQADDLDRFWPRKRAGELDVPTPQERSRLPRQLLAIVHKALAPQPHDRYGTVAAFAADLMAFQAGLAVLAYRDAWHTRIGRWIRLHRNLAYSLLISLAATGIIVWLLWSDKLKEMATWGNPILHETFADEGWRQRWTGHETGDFTAQNGWVTSMSGSHNVLFLRKQLEGGVAIETTAMMRPHHSPNRLAIAWYGGSSPPPTTIFPWPGPARGWQVEIGGYGNSCCCILASPGISFLIRKPMMLMVGQPYRMRVEFDNRRIALYVDGVLTLEHEEPFPLGPGFIGLSGFDTGKSFRDVSIYTKGQSERNGPLAIADRLVQIGLPDRAQEEYARVERSISDPRIMDQARWYQGLAARQQGHHEEADRIWKTLSGSPFLNRVALCHLEDEVRDSKEMDHGRFESLYRQDPSLHPLLHALWGHRAGILQYAPDAADIPTCIDQHLAFRKRLFPDDPTTSNMACRLLQRLQRWEEIVSDHPQEILLAGQALLSLGRIDLSAIHLRDWQVRRNFLISTGRFSACATDDEFDDFYRAWGYCKMDAAKESMRLIPKMAGQALLHLGRAEEVISNAQKHSSAVVNTALWMTGRIQAAASGDPAIPHSGNAAFAWLLLDKPEQARTQGRLKSPFLEWNLLLHHRIHGNRQAEADARKLVMADRLDYRPGTPNAWVGHLLVPLFLDLLDGRIDAFDQALAEARRLDRDHFAGRWYHIAGYVLGQEDGKTFAAQAARSEVAALWCIARALRAERQQDPQAASGAWREFLNLPRHQRLLWTFEEPDPLLERLASWRASATPVPADPTGTKKPPAAPR